MRLPSPTGETRPGRTVLARGAVGQLVGARMYRSRQLRVISPPRLSMAHGRGDHGAVAKDGGTFVGHRREIG
jgi:hypothetical protein